MIIGYFANIPSLLRISMVKNNGKKKKEKEWKKLEQGEMKEEAHQLELKEGYEQDESYEEAKE